jgi:phage terminase large subunit-like protein
MLNLLKRPDPRYSADYLRTLPPLEQKKYLEKLSDSEVSFLEHDWLFWARDEQLPPKEWGKNGCFMWNIRAGRGWGKTRTGAETFIHLVRYGGYTRPNLAGATAEDVRDLMIEGESGILAVAPPDFKPQFVQTTKKLIWPNGVVSHVYYGSEPDKARGPQSDLLWCDELAKWQYAQETFDMLLMGLRLGLNPLCIITSTPRPTKFLMELEKRKDPKGRPSCVVTRGKTEDNIFNLAPVFISTVITAYQGTRQGRQELEGDFLDDNPDALFHQANIDEYRVKSYKDLPLMEYIVVGVDPAAKSSKTSDDTGIVVVGRGSDGDGYVLADYTIHGTPLEWATAAIEAYHKWQANLIVGEINNGGEMIEYTLRSIDQGIPYEAVHASRGKDIRAEPISLLYQQGNFHHYGHFRELEDEITGWIPGESTKSPNRLDALVWGATRLKIVPNPMRLKRELAEGTSYATSMNRKNPYQGMDLTVPKDPY